MKLRRMYLVKHGVDYYKSKLKELRLKFHQEEKRLIRDSVKLKTRNNILSKEYENLSVKLDEFNDTIRILPSKTNEKIMRTLDAKEQTRKEIRTSCIILGKLKTGDNTSKLSRDELHKIDSINTILSDTLSELITMTAQINDIDATAQSILEKTLKTQKGECE